MKIYKCTLTNDSYDIVSDKQYGVRYYSMDF